jgi:hypothetical protein
MHTYWTCTYQESGKLAAVQAAASCDAAYIADADRRAVRRLLIPAEVIQAQEAASPANLAWYDAAIDAAEALEAQAKAASDADPDNQVLHDQWQHDKTQRIRLQDERADVAGREAALSAEMLRVQEVSDATTAADAVLRWGGRTSVDGLTLLTEAAEGSPGPAGPGWTALGDDAAARGYIAANDASWNQPEPT